MTDPQIEDVADTALWIAAYRARESALFQDPLAARLAGEKGVHLARTMVGAEQFHWMTVVRTAVIDELVREAIARGVGTVLNLGAGLDTRPYRLDLPSSLEWIEADVPKIIEHKEALLAREEPRCRLRRIVADLAHPGVIEVVLASVPPDRDALVLTEGVLMYLAEAEVGALARQLRAHQRITEWIVDWSASFLNRAVRVRQAGPNPLKNAPFRFQPHAWESFFAARGWRVAEKRPLPVEGERLGRPLPLPWWFSPVHAVLPRRARDAIREMMGYARLEPT